MTTRRHPKAGNVTGPGAAPATHPTGRSGSRGVRADGQALDPADQGAAEERQRGGGLRETKVRCAVGERADRVP
nr:hypothetical protein KPHV_83080 [Kitasatospora purpeofusca]